MIEQLIKTVLQTLKRNILEIKRVPSVKWCIGLQLPNGPSGFKRNENAQEKVDGILLVGIFWSKEVNELLLKSELINIPENVFE